MKVWGGGVKEEGGGVKEEGGGERPFQQLRVSLLSLLWDLSIREPSVS